MKQNLKFFTLLRKLDGKELMDFEKYLKQEHSKEENSLKVFYYYKRFYPGKESPAKMEEAYAYHKIFGRQMKPVLSDRKRMLNAFSDLHLWLKDFLVLEMLGNDTFVSQILWLNILQEKGLSAEFSKQVILVHRPLEGLTLVNMDACQRQIASGLHYKQHLVQDNPSPDFKALADCLADVKTSADIISLKMHCEFMTAQKVRPQKQKGPLSTPTVQPLMLLYQSILEMLKSGKEEDYDQTETLLKAYLGTIHTDEVVVILRYLHNFAANMVREKDDRVWGKKLHDLDKLLLQKGAYTPKGAISPTNFHNIVNVACAALDLEWAETFVEEHSQYLPEVIRLECERLALATVEFERKDFGKVLELTDSALFKEEAHVIRSKTLHLRAGYELKKDIIDACANFETYLYRHRKPESKFKEAIIAFFKVFKLLVLGSATKKQLLKFLEESPQMYFRSWLKEKIDKYRL